MELGTEIRNRIGHWGSLSRWERSEVGRDLRRLGMSYGEIISLIDVKKSTLATWCRDVELTENQILGIKERTGSVAGIPRDTNWRRRLEIEEIRKGAIAQAELLRNDPISMAGLVLYWGEGGKVRNKFEVTNSDVLALRLFINWVRTYHDPDAEFVLSINLHANNDEPAARSFWSDALDLPDARFHKTFVKSDGTGHRKNHLPYGVCRVKVCRCSNMWQRTMAWIASEAPLLGH